MSETTEKLEADLLGMARDLRHQVYEQFSEVVRLKIELDMAMATIKDQAGEIARLREQLQTRADTVLKL